MDRAGVLNYAGLLAEKLRERMEWHQEPGYGGWWKAQNTQELMIIVATATQALEFFRLYAGPESVWTRQAEALYANNGERQSRESGVRAIGDLLDGWIEQVENNVIDIVGSRVQDEISGARIDLMEQVRQLLLDPDVHPAAPIILCGAALEIAMRSVVGVHNITVAERPTISDLTKALRHARVITVQDVKEIEQCAGLRNLAAHGNFIDLSRERAGLLEQQVSILLRRLEEIPAPSTDLTNS